MRLESSWAHPIRDTRRHLPGWKPACDPACHHYRVSCRGHRNALGAWRKGGCSNRGHWCLSQCFLARLTFKALLVPTVIWRDYTPTGKLLSVFFFERFVLLSGAWTSWVLSKWCSAQIPSNSARMKSTACLVHGNHTVSRFVPIHMVYGSILSTTWQPACSVKCNFSTLHGLHLFTLIFFGRLSDSPLICLWPSPLPCIFLSFWPVSFPGFFPSQFPS